MPPPHADFACLSKKCQTAEGATVYDLPVNATRCPVCGSKRVQRLFTAVNVGSATARAQDKLLDRVMPAQLAAAAEATKPVPDTPVMKLAGASALGAVRGAPGAADASRGVTVPLIQALGKPRPTYAH